MEVCERRQPHGACRPVEGGDGRRRPAAATASGGPHWQPHGCVGRLDDGRPRRRYASRRPSRPGRRRPVAARNDSTVTAGPRRHAGGDASTIAGSPRPVTALPRRSRDDGNRAGPAAAAAARSRPRGGPRWPPPYRARRHNISAMRSPLPRRTARAAHGQRPNAIADFGTCGATTAVPGRQ